MRVIRFVVSMLAVAGIGFGAVTPAIAASAKASNYKGWESLALDNGLIELQVVPDIGGRVIQFKLGGFEYFWVNEQLAGKKPPQSGLGPDGAWLNYGGDKLWPAPQGWSGADEWPGPPGPAPNTEGLPHKTRVIAAEGKEAAIELTGPKDQYAGIQFSRTIRVFDGSTRVSVDSTMTNVDTKPRRWGIWGVTQHNAAKPDGSMNEKLRAYCPINPKSMYPRGYNVLFGLVNNATFSADRENGLARLNYQYRVGKIGLDCSAGWLAVVNGETGNVFVTRFRHDPDKEYPDGASVEFWSQGKGTIICGDTVVDMAEDVADNPHLIESEVLSPFAKLQPGGSYSFHLDWYACTIGGDYPVLDCTDVGVTYSRPEMMNEGNDYYVTGRFGVFHEGKLGFVLYNTQGKEIKRTTSNVPVHPTRSVELKLYPFRNVRESVREVAIVVCGSDGREIGELARAKLTSIIDR